MDEINKHGGSIISLKDIANGVIVDLTLSLIKNLVKEFVPKVKKFFSAGGRGVKSEKRLEQKISKEFEKLLMKVKFITFRIMGNIKWDKVEPLEFGKNEKGEELVKLVFKVEKKMCGIYYEITEKDKQSFFKTSTYEIVENFITQRLVNCGRNDYFDYYCPSCKQTTLTKTSVINNPGEEAISCVLCRGVMPMKIYREYLNDKKHNPSLEYYEGLEERNRRMAEIRNRKWGFI